TTTQLPRRSVRSKRPPLIVVPASAGAGLPSRGLLPSSPSERKPSSSTTRKPTSTTPTTALMLRTVWLGAARRALPWGPAGRSVPEGAEPSASAAVGAGAVAGGGVDDVGG